MTSDDEQAAHQRPHQGGHRAAAEGLLHARATASGTPPPPSATATTRSSPASARELHGRQAGARAAADGAGRRVGRRRRGTEDGLLPAGDRRAAASTSRSGGKLLLMIDPPDKADSPPLTNLIALAHEWGIDVGNNIVVDASGMGQLIGTDASVPVVGALPVARDHGAVQAAHGVPARAIGDAGAGGVNGHTAQSRSSRRPAAAGRKPTSRAADDRQGRARRRRRATRRAGHDRRGGVRRRSKRPTRAKAADEEPGRPEAEPETRIVVIGDSDFAANGALGIQGNRDLFLNTVGWLSQQENLIAIRPKEPDDRRHHDDGDQQKRHHVAVAADHPGAIFAHGRLHLVAEAIMRGLRSLLAPRWCSLGGLVAYIYFVDWKKPPEEATPTKPKGLRRRRGRQDRRAEGHDLGRRAWNAEEGRRQLAAGRARRPRAADEAEVPGITSNLASVEMVRVIDENPANLKRLRADGAASPRSTSRRPATRTTASC